MTTHATPPTTAGTPIPPMPTHAPVPVMLSKPPAGAPAPVTRVAVREQTKRGCKILALKVRNWALLDGVDDATLQAEVTRRNAAEARKARQAHIADIKQVRGQISSAAREGKAAAAERYQQTLATLVASGPAVVHDGPVTDHDVARHRRAQQVYRCAVVAGGVIGGLVMGAQHPLLLIAAILGTLGAAWWAGRPKKDDGSNKTVTPVLVPAPPVEVDPVPYAGTPATPAFDAPPPPALSQEALDIALRSIRLSGFGPESSVNILAAPAWGDDRTCTTVFDLPAGVTVKQLQDKLEGLAGALGRDVTMVDLTKAGAAGRASLWMTDEDPFEKPRPTPLLMHKGGIDAWRDGIPVAWGKRGNIISLPIKDSNFLIAGMTRSGKGVGAANLTVGASLDVRYNLRIVAGKSNGEWDAYAKAGVASTYFKPDAARLLALLQAEIADMTRRNNLLGELGKSKLTPQSIERIGGIEVIVIDELATYTRPGKPYRDEILEALILLSAVAAASGIFLVLITQYPEADVIPQALAMNCGTRWGMRVDNAQQSNAILGGGASGSGRDASKFDPPRPGLGWLVNPFAGVTDLARSFDLDEDEREEVTKILDRAADLRKGAGRLAGEWDDPIEKALIGSTGLSSIAGGPARNGIPGRVALHLNSAQVQQREACRGALIAMDDLGRDTAQLDEMAAIIGGSMTAERLGELLRAAGAGGTVKVAIPGRPNRVNGYRREDIADALSLLEGS